MRRSIRIAITLGIAALVSAVGLVTAGVASDPELTFPERRAGDTIVYEDGLGGERQWEMQPRMTWRTVDGDVHIVDVARAEVGRFTFGGITAQNYAYAMVSPDARTAVASTSGATGHASGSAQFPIGDSEMEWSMSAYMREGEAYVPCGLFHSLQGESGRTMYAQGCDASRFGFDRVTSWEGSDVYVYSAGEEQVWLRPDIAYPVRIVAGDEIWDMVSFARGGELLVDPDLPRPSAALPDVQTIGDDILAAFDGFEYTPRDAIASADADALDTEYQDWRADNPDAVIDRVSFTRDDSTIEWTIHFATADEALNLFATRRPSDADPNLVALGLASEWREDISSFVGGRGLDSDPTSWSGVPDLEALTLAWQGYVGGEELPREGRVFAQDLEDGGFVAEVKTVEVDDIEQGGLLEPTPEQRQTAEGYGLEWQNGRLTVIWAHSGAESQPQPVGLPAPPAESHASDAQVPAGTYPAIASAAVGAGLLAFILLGLKHTPLAGLLVRRRDHPTRDKLLRLIKAQPGIHYQGIIKTTGLGNGTVEHHLRKLVARGDLVVRRKNQYACYFPAGTSRRELDAAGAVKSDGARRILGAIAARPGVGVTDVVEDTGLSPGTVSHHLKRLREGGLVDSWRDGRTVRMRVVA